MATAKKTATTPEKEKGSKVYNFTSENPFLTVSTVGIQFVDGKASTTNLTVAKYLANLDGVALVED